MVRMIVAGASILALVGCWAPGEPVQLPEDTIEAARTCFAAKGLVVRAGKGENDPITYDEFVATIRYPMIAAAQVEPFSAETIGKVLEGANTVAEEIRGKDYAGAVAACDTRFAADSEVSLPDKESDAVLSCLSMAAFMQGAVQTQGGDFGNNGAVIASLMERLQKRMESDPEILVKLAGADDVPALMGEAMKPAFGEGAPGEYIQACAARFPGGG